MVALPANETTLIIAGKSYSPIPKEPPHFLAYEHFKSSDPQLSPFHVTWYGYEKNSKQQIELHIYFDQLGKVLLCQAKDRTSKQELIINSFEEMLLRRYGRELANPVLNKTLSFVTSEYSKYSNEVDRLFQELEKISLHISTQFKKYKTKAKQCLEAIRSKNLWAFGKNDPRERLLIGTISAIEKKFENKQETKLVQSAQLFPPAVDEAPSSEKIPNIDPVVLENQKKEADQQEMKGLLAKLKQIDMDIESLEKKENVSPVDKVIKKIEWVQEQFDLISKSLNILPVEEILEKFRSFNQCQSTLKELFEQKAFEGDIKALEKLSPFIDFSSLMLFANLVKKGDLKVCEFFLKTFPLCQYQMNHTVVAVGKDVGTYSMSLLRLSYIVHKNYAFLEMLLNNGADPNFDGGTVVNSMNILKLIFVDERLTKQERYHFVELFLKYGANLNPPVAQQVRSAFSSPDNKDFRKAKSKIATKGSDFKFDIDDKPLLYVAIMSLDDEAIVALLLKYGASMSEDFKSFDPIGIATSKETSPPNFSVVKTLLSYGGDINALQGAGSNQTSPLLFACQRVPEYLGPVQQLVALGANPNLPAKSFMLHGRKYWEIQITPLLKAVIKGHVNIVTYFFKQTQSPLTYKAIAETCGYYFSFIANKYLIMAASPEGVEVGFACSEKTDSMALLMVNPSIIKYDENEKKTFLNQVAQRAKQYYSQQEYLLAELSFNILFIFGNSEQRLTASYNFASCYRMTDRLNRAKDMYELCVAYKPESQIGKFAQQQIEKLEKKSEKSSEKASSFL